MAAGNINHDESISLLFAYLFIVVDINYLNDLCLLHKYYVYLQISTDRIRVLLSQKRIAF